MAPVGVDNAWEAESGFGSFAERTVELVREGPHDLRREGAVIAEQGAQALVADSVRRGSIIK